MKVSARPLRCCQAMVACLSNFVDCAEIAPMAVARIDVPESRHYWMFIPSSERETLCSFDVTLPPSFIQF